MMTFTGLDQLTVILALLRLFGLGTWKLRLSRSARSSSSLELEFSSVRIPLGRVRFSLKLEAVVDLLELVGSVVITT